MQLYSSRPTHAVWQVIGDVFAVATVAAAVWLSRQVHDAIASLGAFGTRIEDAGSGFAATLSDAGTALSRVPFIGEPIAQPFSDASGSASDLAAAGATLRAGVETLAMTVGTALWVLPLLLVLLVWMLPRVRFASRAGASKRLSATQQGRDLLALRALVGQPMARVLAVVPDPVAAFRSGDPAALAALAGLQLRAAGVSLAGDRRADAAAATREGRGP